MVKVATEATVRTPTARELEKLFALDPALTDMSDEQLTCMAEGHSFPRLRPNRPVPRGVRWYPNSDGTKHIVYVCPVCSTERTRDTAPWGIFDGDVIYHYNYPKWWIHYKLSDEITRYRLKVELSKRYNALLEKSGPSPE